MEEYDDEHDNNFPIGNSVQCPQCGSSDIEEESNNHHLTDDEMEYLEFMKCRSCGYGFVN